MRNVCAENLAQSGHIEIMRGSIKYDVFDRTENGCDSKETGITYQ